MTNKRNSNKENSLLGFNSKAIQEYYDLHYGRHLGADEISEIKFNLVSYIELLIQMDRQHIEWLEQRVQETNDD